MVGDPEVVGYQFRWQGVAELDRIHACQADHAPQLILPVMNHLSCQFGEAGAERVTHSEDRGLPSQGGQPLPTIDPQGAYPSGLDDPPLFLESVGED